jgi:hypothetical protein
LEHFNLGILVVAGAGNTKDMFEDTHSCPFFMKLDGPFWLSKLLAFLPAAILIQY